MTRPLLWPLVPLYRLGLALRERKFRPGSPVVRRLRWPVISIGNLSIDKLPIEMTGQRSRRDRAARPELSLAQGQAEP